MTTHADRDRSEPANVTKPDDERVQRYAEALRDCIEARTVPPVIGTGGGLSLGATEWDMARAVMAVADAEQAEMRAEIEQVRRGARTLGEIVHRQCRDALDATGLHYLIDEDGDGDWGLVWEHLAELRPRLNRAERALADAWAKVARVEALAARFQSIDEYAHLDHRGAGMVTAGAAASAIRDALAGPDPDTTEEAPDARP